MFNSFNQLLVFLMITIDNIFVIIEMMKRISEMLKYLILIVIFMVKNCDFTLDFIYRITCG